MYYVKRPFLKVGLPFLTAMVAATFLLGDMRKTRYEHSTNNSRRLHEPASTETRKNIKTLAEELTVRTNFIALLCFDYRFCF